MIRKIKLVKKKMVSRESTDKMIIVERSKCNMTCKVFGSILRLVTPRVVFYVRSLVMFVRDRDDTVCTV